MIENKERIGNFTSSQIYKLMTNGKAAGSMGVPALTYIKEKQLEIRLGRSVDVEKYSPEMAWGKLMELRVFDMLPFGYELTSQKTDMHPTIKNWSGSKDVIKPVEKIGDIKCYYPKNFALFSDVLMQQDIALFREEFPQEYWQLVSNAIINEVSRVESILYCPYLSELEEIREMAENYDGDDVWQYRFIAESPSSRLPYIPDGGYYKNLITFEFEVPKEDIKALTGRVMMARSILQKNRSVISAKWISARLISKQPMQEKQPKKRPKRNARKENVCKRNWTIKKQPNKKQKPINRQPSKRNWQKVTLKSSMTFWKS